ncbi:MAG: DUF4159 domain-containing protein [Alphaproteobacteria bacterium]
MPFFPDLVFLNPWLLVTLTALPLLWLVLRITPPAPRRIKLPTVRFLEGLIAERQTASRTPWWLLLLRLAVLVCLIVAFADPVYKPAAAIASGDTVRLILDNGWDSAANWDRQIKAASDILARAERNTGKPKIYVLTTAPAPGEKNPFAAGPMAAGEARTMIKTLEPHPWPSDYGAALSVLKKHPQNAQNFWFSAGLSASGFERLATELISSGGLNFYAPSSGYLPALLKKAGAHANDIQISLAVPDNTKSGTPFIVQAVSSRGAVLDQQTLTWKSAGAALRSSFEIPAKLSNQLAEFRLAGRPGAGSIYKLSSTAAKRTVGILGATDKNAKPFVEARYYIERALEPYAELVIGDYDSIFAAEPSVIILPDGGNIPADALGRLENWVKKGGLLLRFAGPDMAAYTGQPYLLPVHLRAGDRAGGGTLSWEKTAKLRRFSENSPLAGIMMPADITIRRQILAESADLADKTWASLDDGTPLITAAPLEDGLIVMIHTAPLPIWSDLPLSGVFVEILKQLVDIAGVKYNPADKTSKIMRPLRVLDGFGKMTAPDNTVQPIASEDFADTKISSSHPPGIYGHDSYQKILNLGDRVSTVNTADTLPAGAHRQNYDQTYEHNHKPGILLAALCLFLLDWSILIVMARGFSLGGLALLILCAAFSSPSYAADFQNDTKYAEGFYLAYLQTGDEAVDSTSQRGLENLAKILQTRTSAEPLGVAAINPARDTLAFFPFLYWPISSNAGTLSQESIKNIQSYLDNGGTILFDTRDGSEDTGGFGMSSHSQKLQRILSSFSLPALEPAPPDHVLMRSFYLLRETPGRFPDGALWIEGVSAPGRDGVSSVIIGTYDWAGEWAEPRATQQQELAYRFGVNVVMYALTGNYKSDQVHVSHILERLGQ